MATTKKTAQEEEIKKAEQVVNAEQVEQAENTVAASEIAPAETAEEEKVETPSASVDLSKAAGFKAVDAEGNELGIVTMQELQDTIASQVLEVISQRMQASTLEQPAMLAANASTRAASDAFENQLTEQSDFQWVRTLASDGSSTRVNKDNFAQVVGGLLPTYGISLTTSYPDLTVDSPIYINIENNKCYLISIDYPYEKQGAIVYIKSYGELVLLNNTLPTAITFEIDNSIFIIRALSGKRGMLIKYIKF